eukprot:13982729-Alexandrium_andersonii.AAC.1
MDGEGADGTKLAAGGGKRRRAADGSALPAEDGEPSATAAPSTSESSQPAKVFIKCPKGKARLCDAGGSGNCGWLAT